MKRTFSRLLRALALISLPMLVVGSSELRAQSQDWSATLMAPAFPSPYISEWERNPQSLVLTLNYSGQSAREYRVVGSVRGPGRTEMIRAESPLMTMAPGPHTEILNATDLFDWRIMPAHRDYVEKLARTGVFPEGDYEVCAWVYSKSGLQLSESCAPVTIANPERPELIFPASGGPVTMRQPTFQWTPVMVPPALGVTYRVRIVERLPGQAPRTAMSANRVHFEEETTGVPMLLYPLDAQPLEEGKEYVWRVEALDGMGSPLAANGLRSELWTFTYSALGGVIDGIGDIDLSLGMPDEMTLVPGLARLTGLKQVTAEAGHFGALLNGVARLELEGALEGVVPVRLQDLEIEAVGGQLQARAGRLVGQLARDFISRDILGPYVTLDQLEYTPNEGIRVGGAIELPGGRKTKLSGDTYLTAFGIYGTLEARAGSGEPLLGVDGGPVGLRIDGARISLPDGGLDLAGKIDLFGKPSECSDISGRLSDTGEWQAHLHCGGQIQIPLAGTGDRARITLGSVIGTLALGLETRDLSHALDLSAVLDLDAGEGGSCGAAFDMKLSNGEVAVENLIPRCGNGARSDMDWLELGLSNLRIEELGWTPASGFGFRMLVDLSPSLPKLPEFRLPQLNDVAIGTDGFRVPAIDEPVGPLSLGVAGFGVRVTGVRTSGFDLSWDDWQERRAGSANFGLDLELTMPRLLGSAPACLTRRAPTASASLADGRLAIELEDRSYAPGECNFELVDGVAFEIEKVSGGVEVALQPQLALERLPELAGSVTLPEIFRCSAGQGQQVASGPQTAGEKLAISGGVSIGPDGELAGRVEGIFPPCPLGFAGVEVALSNAALEFGGDATERSIVLSGGGEATFELGGDPISGSGEVEVDIIAGKLVGGALEFNGPIEFGFPREEPLLSFRLGSARLDTLGLHVDGRQELVLPDGTTIGSTFDNVIFDPYAFALVDGAILFDQPFALNIGVGDAGALSWGAVSEGAEFVLDVGARVDLPSVIRIDKSGLSINGGGGARLVYGGRDVSDLAAAFTDDFTIAMDPLGVTAGDLTLSHDGIPLATIDARGFHPNLAYIGAALLPERMGLPNADIAYLELRDEDGTLRIATENVGQGIRAYTLPDERVPLVLPALQFDASSAPELAVGFDFTLDPMGEIIAGSMEVAVPTGQESIFDLRRRDIPFVVDSLIYADRDGSGHALILGGRLELPGGLTEGAGSITVELNPSGRLRGDFVLNSAWSGDLLPDSEALRYSFDGLEGSVDIDLAAPLTSRWRVDLSGALELALGEGEPYRVGTTIRSTHLGITVPHLDAGLPDIFTYFDLAGVRLGIGDLKIPSLSFDELEGWDFEFKFDLAFEFPEFGGLKLPTIPDVQLGRSGLKLPSLVHAEGLEASRFELAGFQFEPLAFKMAELHFNPLSGNLPEDWGFAFDFELGFGELPDWVPGELKNLKLTILDAGFSNGKLTGEIEALGFPDGPGIELPFGSSGMAYNLLSIGGSLLEEGGEQRVALTTSGSWSLPEFLRCDDAAGPVALGDAVLALDSRAGLSGTIEDIVPACPVTFGPLALQATRSNLVFDVGPDGQMVNLDLEGGLRLPTLVEGETTEVTGALVLDLIGQKVVSGGIDVKEPFRWGLPLENPFLTFAVRDARLDERGFVFSGEGGVHLEGETEVGIAFNDLTFDLPTLAITDGSATIEGGFALDAEFERGLRWATRPASTERPAGPGLRLLLPDQATIDMNGLALTGRGAGELALNDSLFTSLAVNFTDEFRLGFAPVGVESGRAGFELDGTEVAHLDASGLHPGDIFGLVPIPARLGLPSESLAYLQLRDPADTTQLLVETEMEGSNLSIRTNSGKAVSLVVPALAAGSEAPPEVRASFEIVVNPSTFAFVSGSISVAASEEADALFRLREYGLPLEVRRLSYDDADGKGYALRVGARLELPDALSGTIIDFDDITISEDGLTGSIALGSYLEGAPAGAAPVATFGAEESLALRVMGARAVFGDQPKVELAGEFLTGLFVDEEKVAAPLAFEAGVTTTGLSFQIDPSDLEDARLPLGVGFFKPEQLETDRKPIDVVIGDRDISVRVDGVFSMPALGEEFAITIAGLEIGTAGFKVPTIAMNLPEEWHRFNLFGAKFTLQGREGRPGIEVGFSDAVLALTLSGEVEVLENTTTFEGLRIASDGSVTLEKASLLSEPIALIQNTLELTDLRIADTKLHIDLAVELPAPFDETGKHDVTVSINPDGRVEGSAKIMLLAPEAPGLGSGKREFDAGLAVLHLRYLAVELSLGSGRIDGGVEMVSDVYLAGGDGNRIMVGDWDGNNVTPGLRLGFNGEVTWEEIAIEDPFSFDFEVLKIGITKAWARPDPSNHSVWFGFNGEFGLNVPSFSGEIGYEHVYINSSLGMDFSEASVSKAEVTIAEVVKLEFKEFNYSSTPTTIALPAGQMPTENSESVEEGTVEVDVESYLTFGGTVEVVGVFSGGVDRFLLYRALDEGGRESTTLIIDNANLAIGDVVKMNADLRMVQRPDGFEILLGARADIIEVMSAAVVGMLEIGPTSQDFRAGLFVAVETSAGGVPIVPGVLTLNGIGGGFFYNARPEHINLVKKYSGLDGNSDVSFTQRAPGKFTGMLYASAVIVDPMVAQARILLTISEVSTELNGRIGLLSTSSDIEAAKIRGDLFLGVGYGTEKYAEGNLKMSANFDPLISTPTPIQVSFFVYGQDAWGVYGGGSLKYLMGLVEGNGDFFVGPPGFMVSLNLKAGFNFWIVDVNGYIDGSIWYLRDPFELGGFMTVGVDVAVAGGAVGCGAELRGAVLGSEARSYIYAGAQAGCYVLGFEKDVSIWAKFEGRKVTGGFGYDPTMDEIIARANSVRREMTSTADAMKDAITEARPEPQTVGLSKSELADAYQRMERLGLDSLNIIMARARGHERRFYRWLGSGTESSELSNYFQWYRRVLTQAGSPRLSGSRSLESYSSSIETLVRRISSRQSKVSERITLAQTEIREMQWVAARSWPESPVRQTSLEEPQWRTGTDADGNTIRVLESGPGFEIDRSAASQARASLEDYEAEIEEVARQIREQIAELESGVRNVENILLGTGVYSPLSFAKLHSDVVELALEQRARHGDLLLRKQDWFNAQLDSLETKRVRLQSLINLKTDYAWGEYGRAIGNPEGMMNAIRTLDSLAYHRLEALADISGNYNALNSYKQTRLNIGNQVLSWLRSQSKRAGMELWYELGAAGFQRAHDIAGAEFRKLTTGDFPSFVKLRGQHMRLSMTLNALYLQHAELVGSLYDIQDRYSVWLGRVTTDDGVSSTAQEGYERELQGVQTRLAELQRELQVPDNITPKVTSYAEGYLSREVVTWSGSHPTGTYDHLFYVDEPEWLFAKALQAVASWFNLIDRDDLMDGLVSVGRNGNLTRYTLTPERGTRRKTRNAKFAVRGGAGYYGFRTLQYTSLYEDFTNLTGTVQQRLFEAGVSSVTAEPTPDTSRPTTPKIELVGHEGSGIYWLPNTDRIEVEWSSSHWSSGIAEYQYAVGTLQDTTSRRDWTSAGGRTKVAIHGIELSEGEKVRVFVRARSGAGVWSLAQRSPEIGYDPSPPVFESTSSTSVVASDPPRLDVDDYSRLNRAAHPVCKTGNQIQDFMNGKLGGSMTPPASTGGSASVTPPVVRYLRPIARDQQSGVANYYWQVTRGSEPAVFEGPEGWNRMAPSTRNIMIEGSPLSYDRESTITIVAVNKAGLASEPHIETFTAEDRTPPIIPQFCIGQQIGVMDDMVQPVLALGLSDLPYDTESGLQSLEYRVRRPEGQLLSDWQRLDENELRNIKAYGILALPKIQVESGQEYMVDLLAWNRNNLGSVSSAGPFTVDATPPPAPALTGFNGLAITGRGTVLDFGLRMVNDPESNTVAWAWQVVDARFDGWQGETTMETPDGSRDGALFHGVEGVSGSGTMSIRGNTGIMRGLGSSDRLYKLQFVSFNGVGMASTIRSVYFQVVGGRVATVPAEKAREMIEALP